jgi:hypothetical protein
VDESDFRSVEDTIDSARFNIKQIIKMAANASFASPVADATFGRIPELPLLDGVLATIYGLTGWQIALTIFLGLVAYDQSMSITQCQM